MFKVLIVDDEAVIRDGLNTLIDWNEMGFEICGTAVNGKDGVSKALELKPDFIITDIRMPGMNGLEMIKELKSSNINCIYLLLTGYSDFSYIQGAIRLGVKDYLLKPIDETELIESVKNVYKILKDKEEK